MVRNSYKERIVINDKFSHIGSFLEELPIHFHNEGETIYEGRNTIKTYDVENTFINVKYFKKPHLVNQFAYATLRESKAARSYKYAQKLLQLGINTPTPIAYMEYSRPFMLKYSFYVSEHINVDGLMRVLQTGTLDEHEELILQFARFTAKLHDLKIYHFDYSPGNILFKKGQEGEYSFYLVDLNRMEFDKDIDVKKAAYNFRRLWGSNEMIKAFTKEYALRRGLNPELCINLVEEYRTDFWKRLNRKHPEAQPYIESK